MSALFSSDRVSVSQHAFQDVAVAYLCPDQFISGGGSREFEPEIAHHGRDDRLLFQLPEPVEVTRQNREHDIAVADLAAVIDGYQAVGIAVKCQPDVRTVFTHGAR